MKKHNYRTPFVVGGVFLFFVGLWFSSRDAQPRVEGVETIADLGNQHIDTIASDHAPYNSNPPTSGAHIGAIAPWGVHTEIIPDEQQVHNLEDGGVIVQYNPDILPKDSWKVLEDVAMDAGRRHVIVAPRYNMEHTIVVTAWNTILSLDTVEEERIQQFIRAYEGIDHHK